MYIYTHTHTHIYTYKRLSVVSLFSVSPCPPYLSSVAPLPPFSSWPSSSFFPCRLSRVSLQTYQVKTSECNLPTRDPPAGGCLLPAQHTASRQLLLLATLLFNSRVAGVAVRLVRRSIAVKSSRCLLETLTCECLPRSATFLSVCRCDPTKQLCHYFNVSYT